MKPYEYKNGQAIKDLDPKNRIVVFYAAVFDNLDSDNDIIRKGAFTKTIQENGPMGKNRIMHLREHEACEVISKPFELNEDGVGLLCKSKLPDTELANETLKLYEAGILTEHSIGYQTIKAIYPDGEGWGKKRELLELKLWEVSTCTWGANELAKFVGTKAEQKIKAFDYLNKLINAVQKGRFNENTEDLLTIELKKIQALIHSLESPEPEPTPEPSNEPKVLQELLLTFKNSLS